MKESPIQRISLLLAAAFGLSLLPVAVSAAPQCDELEPVHEIEEALEDAEVPVAPDVIHEVEGAGCAVLGLLP